MMQALAGYDPEDPASADVPVPDYRAALAKRLDGLTIGVVRHFHETDAVADFGSRERAVARLCRGVRCRVPDLESLGARLVDLQLSPLIDYLDANRLIMLAEAYALHETRFPRAAAPSRASHVRPDRARRLPRARPIMSRRCGKGASWRSNSPGR